MDNKLIYEKVADERDVSPIQLNSFSHEIQNLDLWSASWLLWLGDGQIQAVIFS